MITHIVISVVKNFIQILKMIFLAIALFVSINILDVGQYSFALLINASILD